MSSCVLNNGHASPFFQVHRGVRQGCPLSGLLFVIGIEILAKALQKDESIKGILVGEKEIRLSQFADVSIIETAMSIQTSIRAGNQSRAKQKPCG